MAARYALYYLFSWMLYRVARQACPTCGASSGRCEDEIFFHKVRIMRAATKVVDAGYGFREKI